MGADILISVIVPVYRVEQYLEQCIQSIQSQTYKNLEIILVDDGSDDQCPQICDQYAKEDERIKVIHKKNGGADSARKAGMMIATGKYVGYVDGDDWIEPIMYEKLLEYACKYNVEVVESGVIDTYEEMERRRTLRLKEGCYTGRNFTEKVEPKLLYSGFFFEYGISPYLVSKLFLREKIMKYQMLPGIVNEVQDDTMVALPCIAESKNVYISHECYYHYRVRNTSTKRECRRYEVANVFKSYHEFYARFEGTKLCSKDDRQIKYFLMYWLLYKAPHIFDNISDGNFLIPYGGINIRDKIVLYGAGAAGIHLENYIRNIEGSNIVCWTDRNYKDLKKALNVKSPGEIINCDYDYVLISILRESAVQSARKDLIEIGVPAGKILWIEQKFIDNPELLLNRIMYQGKLLGGC